MLCTAEMTYEHAILCIAINFKQKIVHVYPTLSVGPTYHISCPVSFCDMHIFIICTNILQSLNDLC
jgi:hypothetical protein